MENKLMGSAAPSAPGSASGDGASPMPNMNAAPNAGSGQPGQQPGSKLMGPQGAPVPPSMPSVAELVDGLHKTAYLRGAFQHLLQSDKLPDKKAILSLSSDLLQKGILSAPRLATELATLPDNPEEIQKWVQQHFETTDRQVDQLAAILHNASDPGHPLNGGRAPPMAQ